MKCEAIITPIPDIEAPLTVGQDFLLNCRGDWPVGIKSEEVKLNLPVEAKYILQLRGFELRSQAEADLKVVSYTPGKVAIPDVILQTNKGDISLGPIQFEVTSVLVAPQPGEQPKPFGPLGPAVISWPFLYTLIIACVFVTFFGIVGSILLRKWQRKKLLQDLENRDSSQTPVNQFYQSIRSLERQNALFFSDHSRVGSQKVSEKDASQAVEVLDRALKTYLCREFLIPAFHWKPGLVSRDFVKQNRRHFEALGSQLKILLKEFYRIQKTQSISDVDALALFKKTQRWVDEAEKQKGKK